MSVERRLRIGFLWGLLALAPLGASAKPEAGVPEAPSGTWYAQGGRTLAGGQHAVEAALGWPGLRLGGRLGIAQGVEISPYLTFTWWNDLLDKKATLANALGAYAKYSLVARGPFHLALQANPALTVEYWPDGTRIGWQIGFPEVLMSYEVTRGLEIDFGIRVPLSLVFKSGYRLEVRLPVLVSMGAEYALTKDLHLFGAVDIGPQFRFASREPTCRRLGPTMTLCDETRTTGGNRTGAMLNALVGVTYLVP